MGKPGAISTAISAIDICLWDLKARLFDKPVIDLLGQARKTIPAYGSGGFTSYTEQQLLSQVTGWVEEGLGSVKMKIGSEPHQDLARVTAVARALNGRAELFVDANGAYTRKQALQKAEEFGQLGVSWFEEPVSSDDRHGLRLLVERSPACMDIAAGEYIYVLDDARLLLEDGAVDVLQADVTRCGGVSGFLKIAAACELHHLPLSAHTAPSIHATLCCAVLPAMNVEYFHDHVRIEKMFFDGAISAQHGNLQPDHTRRGFGLELKQSDAAPFKVFESELH
jgi:L-alanine-DL-glutamate epimerase-like enolase superfamily enzyme